MLGFFVGLHANFVDAVGNVLLLRGFQRFRQRIIKDDTLARIGHQFVDQNHLRRRLVLQTVEPRFTLFDIPLQRLGLCQLHLFLLHQLVVAGVQFRQFALKRGAGSGVLFDRDLVFEVDNLGIEVQNIRPRFFQGPNGGFPFGQRFREVALNLDLLLIKHGQLALKQLLDHV